MGAKYTPDRRQGTGGHGARRVERTGKKRADPDPELAATRQDRCLLCPRTRRSLPRLKNAPQSPDFESEMGSRSCLLAAAAPRTLLVDRIVDYAKSSRPGRFKSTRIPGKY